MLVEQAAEMEMYCFRPQIQTSLFPFSQLIPCIWDVFCVLHSAVSQSGGQAQGVLKVNGFGNTQRFKHHMDRLIIYKLFKVEPIQNTVGLR